MAFEDKLEYDIEQELGVFDEKGNTSLELRVVSWNKKPAKLELRKWVTNSDGQNPNKGFSFLTDEGPHRLAELLVENNFGDTKTLKALLIDRDDYDESESDYDYLDEEEE
jgi:hypothetical protein